MKDLLIVFMYRLIEDYIPVKKLELLIKDIVEANPQFADEAILTKATTFVNLLVGKERPVNDDDKSLDNFIEFITTQICDYRQRKDEHLVECESHKKSENQKLSRSEADKTPLLSTAERHEMTREEAIQAINEIKLAFGTDDTINEVASILQSELGGETESEIKIFDADGKEVSKADVETKNMNILGLGEKISEVSKELNELSKMDQCLVNDEVKARYIQLRKMLENYSEDYEKMISAKNVNDHTDLVNRMFGGAD